MRKCFNRWILAALSLTACISYHDTTERIGALKPLQSLRQLQGTYVSLPISHNGVPPEMSQSLASHFDLRLIRNDGLFTHFDDTAATVRITYLNDQQFLTQAFDAKGNLVVEQTHAVSPKFIFSAAGLCEARTKLGDGDAVTSGTISNCFTLSEKGNLLHRQKIIATGNLIPAFRHTIDYLEYVRLK